MIRTIEVICIPCQKCKFLKNAIDYAIKFIGRKYNIEINYVYKFTPNLRDVSKYSVNASQAPIMVVNDNVELCGQVSQDAVVAKLDYLHKRG